MNKTDVIKLRIDSDVKIELEKISETASTINHHPAGTPATTAGNPGTWRQNMTLTIRLNPSDAIQYGRNSKTYMIDLDITTLTTEQQEWLANATDSLGVIWNTNILTDNGEITPDSIQAAIYRRAAEVAEENATKRHQNRLKLDRMAAGVKNYLAGSAHPGSSTLILPHAATQAEEMEREGYIAQVEDETQRRRNAEKSRDERKLDQLTDAVNSLGSPSQRERWAAGVMPRNEALGLIWRGPQFAEKLIAGGYEPMFNEIHGACDSASQKHTITDEQWAEVKKLMALMPEGTITSYWHQYVEGDDEAETYDLVRFTRLIGEYKLEADVIL